MIALLYLAIGLAAGSLSALIGTGAGLIIIPALIVFGHFSSKMAIGTSLAVFMAPLGLFAVASYYKHGFVNVHVAALIMAGFVVGSIIVSQFATGLSPQLLGRIFGVVAIAIGVRMLVAG